jgi:Na+-translocating ferredoxin:NAD+ oxidoreductase RnfA subunit
MIGALKLSTLCMRWYLGAFLFIFTPPLLKAIIGNILVAAAVIINFLGDVLFVGKSHPLISGAAGAACATFLLSLFIYNCLYGCSNIFLLLLTFINTRCNIF